MLTCAKVGDECHSVAHLEGRGGARPLIYSEKFVNQCKTQAKIRYFESFT